MEEPELFVAPYVDSLKKNTFSLEKYEPLFEPCTANMDHAIKNRVQPVHLDEAQPKCSRLGNQDMVPVP